MGIIGAKTPRPDALDPGLYWVIPAGREPTVGVLKCPDPVGPGIDLGDLLAGEVQSRSKFIPTFAGGSRS